MDRKLAALPALPLALGVIIGVLLPGAESFIEYLVPAVAVAAGFYIIAKTRGYSAFYFFAGLVTSVFAWFVHSPAEPPQHIFDGNGHDFILVVETVHEGDVGSRLTADVLQANGESSGAHRCYLSLSDNSVTFDPGDVIRVTSVAERADALAAIPTAVSVVRAAKADGISLTLLASSTSVTKIGSVGGLRIRLLRCRRRIADAIYSSPLPPETASLLVAGCLGTGDAPAAVKERFRATGLSHLLCVSGFHVAVVAWIISLFLWPLRVWTRFGRIRYGLLVICVWCYVCLVGASPSAVRAAVMLTTFYLARLLQRPSTPYNSLALAVAIMLLIEPLWLYSAGFQLSVSAVLGLLLFAGRLNPVPMRYQYLYRLVSLVTVPIAAMLGTLPVILLWFHRLPLLSVPVNALASLVFVPLMILGFGAMLLYCFGFSLTWLNPLLQALTDTIYGLCDRAMEISWHQSACILMCDVALIAVSAAVISLAVLLYARKAVIKLCSAIIAVIAVVIAMFIPEDRRCDEAFIYGNSRNTEVYVFRGDTVNITLGHGNRPSLYAIDDYIEVRGSVRAFTEGSMITLARRGMTEDAPKCKILVIDGSYRGRVEDLVAVAEPLSVFVGVNCKTELRDSIKRECTRRAIPFKLLADGVERLELVDIESDSSDSLAEI